MAVRPGHFDVQRMTTGWTGSIRVSSPASCEKPNATRPDRKDHAKSSPIDHNRNIPAHALESCLCSFSPAAFSRTERS